MLCKIADLIAEVPEAGGLAPRCREYLYHGEEEPRIVIREEDYRPQRWPTVLPQFIPYMESGSLFYRELLRYDGMMLHSSAVELDGRVYLFSGNCGAGKSTHARLWKEYFKDRVTVINDDKPIIIKTANGFTVYGTPFTGKHRIGENISSPVKAVCEIVQSKENRVEVLSKSHAVGVLYNQVVRPSVKDASLNLLDMIERLADSVKVVRLYCDVSTDAVKVCYNAVKG
jgi:hypothetical protein